MILAISDCTKSQPGDLPHAGRDSYHWPTAQYILEELLNVTYGNIISWKLFHDCLPIMTMASCMQSSVRHPAGSHCSERIN